MQQVMGNSTPFGGKNIIVLGGFFQIIPVGDSYLYIDIITYFIKSLEDRKIQKTIYRNKNKQKVNEISYRGAELFTKFQLIQLNDQVRAADDVQQMETILNLRSFNGNNVSDKLLKSLIHNNTLTKNDFINKETNNSSKSWYSAPL